MNKLKKSLFSTLLIASFGNIFANDIISTQKTIKCNYSESNLTTVLKFENAVLSYLTADGNLNEINNYISDKYIQHYPLAADGVSGLKSYLTNLKKTNAFKDAHFQIKCTTG